MQAKADNQTKKRVGSHFVRIRELVRKHQPTTSQKLMELTGCSISAVNRCAAATPEMVRAARGLWTWSETTKAKPTKAKPTKAKKPTAKPYTGKKKSKQAKESRPRKQQVASHDGHQLGPAFKLAEIMREIQRLEKQRQEVCRLLEPLNKAAKEILVRVGANMGLVLVEHSCAPPPGVESEPSHGPVNEPSHEPLHEASDQPVNAPPIAQPVASAKALPSETQPEAPQASKRSKGRPRKVERFKAPVTIANQQAAQSPAHTSYELRSGKLTLRTYATLDEAMREFKRESMRCELVKIENGEVALLAKKASTYKPPTEPKTKEQIEKKERRAMRKRYPPVMPGVKNYQRNNTINEEE